MSPRTAPTDPLYALAVDHLRKIFAGDPDPDRRTIHDIYVANNRDLTDVERNKHWLRDFMTDIRYYGLADSIRSSANDKTVEGVQLTPEGKQALRIAANSVDPHNTDPTSQPLLDKIAHDVAIAIHQYPNLEIELRINVREGAKSASR